MDSPLPVEMEELLDIIVEAYKAIQIVEVPHVPIIRNHFFRTFDDVQEDICYNRYRFLKQDLWRLHRALRLDQLGPCIKCDTGKSNVNRFGTEEALLILLHRFAFPTRYVDMVPFYGRDISA